MRILHVALPDDWARAVEDGSYDVSSRGVSLVDEGFVHASTLDQVAVVLDRYYADVAAVNILVVDLDRLDHEGAQVIWEQVGDVGLFPHVYGVIPAQTVVDVVRLEHEPGQPWPAVQVEDVATGPQD
jgi:glutathione S-transferase